MLMRHLIKRNGHIGQTDLEQILYVAESITMIAEMDTLRGPDKSTRPHKLACIHTYMNTKHIIYMYHTTTHKEIHTLNVSASTFGSHNK